MRSTWTSSASVAANSDPWLPLRRCPPSGPPVPASPSRISTTSPTQHDLRLMTASSQSMHTRRRATPKRSRHAHRATWSMHRSRLRAAVHRPTVECSGILRPGARRRGGQVTEPAPQPRDRVVLDRRTAIEDEHAALARGLNAVAQTDAGRAEDPIPAGSPFDSRRSARSGQGGPGLHQRTI
jgi:hypothetical protein